MKIRDLMREMEEIAPERLAEEWDNPGLLTGNPEDVLSGVLLCVDATGEAIDQAIARGATCIVAHHPLMFAGIKTLRTDRYEGALLARLIREGIALFAAHTNLDRTEGGVEDSLAAALGLAVDGGMEYVRAGRIAPQTAGSFLATVRQTLSPQAVFYGEAGRSIERVAVSCGGGGCYFREAAALGADLFLTGEMKHHERIEAQGLGMEIIIAGHDETERVALEPLRRRLSTRLEVPVFVKA